MNTDFWNDMSKGQQITAAGGVTALVGGFLPWYGLKEQFLDSVSFRGTEFTFGWMGLLLLLGAVALTVAPAFGKRLEDVTGSDKIAGEQVAVAAAGLGALLWLVRLVQVPSLFFSVMGRSIGLYIAVAGAIAVTTGVVLTMKEKGIAMPNGDTIAALRASDDAVPAAPHQDGRF